MGSCRLSSFDNVRTSLRIGQRYPKNVQNPFHWYEVVFKLPSAINYDQDLPCVQLVQKDNKILAEINLFFGNGRVHSPAGGLVHAAFRRSFTVLQYLGNLFALRKYRLPSSHLSDWNGGFIYTDQILHRTFLSQIKWDRLKNDICFVKEYVDKNKNPS